MSDQRAAWANQKKSRKGTPKSKAGCLTCKIRHIKCDEAKPACKNCSGTGRKCDFLDPSVTPSISPKFGPRQRNQKPRDLEKSLAIPNRHYTLQPKPLDSICTSSPLSREEADHFDYFRTVCAKSLSGYFKNTLWQTLILQVSQSEPCIQYALEALSTLLRALASSFEINSVVETQESSKLYLKALNSLNHRLDNSAFGWELALIGSMLFMAFEVLRGNDPYALYHLQGGFAIMKECTTKFPNLPGNLEVLSTAFSRADIQASTFAVDYVAKSLRQPFCPTSFAHLTQARDTLNDIIAHTYHILKPHGNRHSTLPYTPLPSTIATQVKSIERLLKTWSETFERFISSRNPEETKPETVGANVLRILHLSTWIHFSTFFYRDQLAYDAFTKEFTKIVGLAESVLSDVSTRSNISSLSFDIGIIAPLYQVAHKCRDARLRRRAIELLKRAGREGVWDGKAMAAVGTWAMEQEEATSGGSNFIEDEARLHEIGLWVNRHVKRMRLTSRRRSCDGTLQYVMGEVHWGHNNRTEGGANEERVFGGFEFYITKWREHMEEIS